MIVKSYNTKEKEFKGVKFEVLAVGKKMMLTKMKYKKGNKVPFHSHPNEQNGYVISEEYHIEYENLKEIIKQGDSYSIPKNSEHSLEALEDGVIIDAFSPPRKDYE